MFFFSSRRRHTIWPRDWSSDVCSSDLLYIVAGHTSPLGTPRTLTTSPLVLAHEDAGRLLAVAGLDAAAEVMDLVPQLHAPTVDVAHSRNSPSTDTPWGYTVRA